VFNRLVGSNVLLLEGNDTARNRLKECLEALGAKVDAFESAVKGLKNLSSTDISKLDAVLVSSQLTDISGSVA